MNKYKITTIVLAVILVMIVIYISIGKYQQNKEQKQMEIYQQGAQLGYEQAITQIMQQAATCQQVPVTFQNQTLNLIAVECLQE